jgi:hypothetical protein
MNEPLRERMVDPFPEERAERMWERIAARRDRGGTKARAARGLLAGLALGVGVLLGASVVWLHGRQAAQRSEVSIAAVPADRETGMPPTSSPPAALPAREVATLPVPSAVELPPRPHRSTLPRPPSRSEGDDVNPYVSDQSLPQRRSMPLDQADACNPYR